MLDDQDFIEEPHAAPNLSPQGTTEFELY